MAYHRSGDRILSSDEYYDELIFKWKIGLFILGGVLIGFGMYASLPEEWAKIWRFLMIIAAGAAGGGVLAYFAREVEAMAGWAVRLGVLLLIGCGIWNLI